MTADERPEDPGWGPAARAGLWVLVPWPLSSFVGRWRRRRDQTASPLVALRKLFAHFCAGLLYVSLIVAVLSLNDAFAEGSTVGPSTAATIIALVGSLSLVAIMVVRKRTLECASDEALVRSFSGRTLLGVSFAEMSLVAGFVASLLAGSNLPYFIGAGFGACGLRLIAPTFSEVARSQASLDAVGCSRSLAAALTTPPSNQAASA